LGTPAIDVHVFGGYAFSQSDAQRRLPVLMTPGVLYVLETLMGLPPSSNTGYVRFKFWCNPFCL
jgi:hypothetical protein